MNLDMTKLEPLLGTIVSELGAAANASLVLTGERLGLWQALAEHGPSTSAELAAKTGTRERYVREWLASQASSGFATYDAAADRFFLSPEQAAVFADEQSPVSMTGGFHSLAAVYEARPKLEDAFRNGHGIHWGDHSNCLFCGVERFYRSGYKASLVAEWLPALDGVVEKLERGAKVADIGCGHGVSTVLMAAAFPNAEFVGVDFHPASIEAARAHAREHGVDGNVRFEVGLAKDYAGAGYDLVTFLDCLHDMGDPVGAARHVRETLAPDGTWMIVEPMAQDRLEDNLTPVGRLYYAGSTMICVPTSLAQEMGAALGAQAGEARLREVVTGSGFTRFRRVVETPFNMILEARP
jgi:2-polyprenyl-3-methyl-5-hydroxy-6-metoxy-1,4-benzoquinol methylase